MPSSVILSHLSVKPTGNLDTTGVTTDVLTVEGNATAETMTATAFVGDGSSLTGVVLPLIINSVQITDANWVPIDDTAIVPSGGFFILEGVGFAPGCLVKIASNNVSATSYVDANHLRIQTGARTPGTYDISVIRGDSQTATLPSAIHISDNVTWITSGNLGTILEDQPFSIALEAVSDSQVMYANVDILPPQSSLNQTTGLLEGNVSNVLDDTLYSFVCTATDAEFQDASSTFLIQYLAALRVSKLATGQNHSLALSDTGRVLGWGYNIDGQTGVGNTSSPIEFPVDVSNRGSLSGRVITDIGCIINTSAALTSDGVVHCWGRNGLGEVGQGNTINPQLLPVAVTGGALAGKTVTALSCGTFHMIALAGGTVYAWGRNVEGQIGQGHTTNPQTLPVAVVGSLSGKTVLKITSGGYHCLALCSDNSVHSWGSGSHGQLGTGDTNNQTLPIQITNNGSLSGRTVVDIQAGQRHTVFLCSDHSVHCVGYNNVGQCAVGNFESPQLTITNISDNGSLSGREVELVGCTAQNTHVRCTDGSIHAWGIGAFGTIGDDDTVDRNLPVEITASGALADKTVIGFTDGGGGNPYHQFAIVDTGKGVVGWGKNGLYHLGDGTTGRRYVPVDVTPNILPRFTPYIAKIATGQNHTIILSSRGRLAGVGFNADGQTGTGDTVTPVTLPTDITTKGSLSGRVITDIGCMVSASAALTSDGVVHCWGVNSNAECGQGHVIDPQLLPVAVTSGALAGKYVVAISCGSNYMLALDSGGVVYAWGINNVGQCGQGDKVTPQTLPVAITGGSLSGKTVVKISTGTKHSFALCSDNTVHSWGHGVNGKLATGNTSDQTLPVDVTNTDSLSGRTVVDIQCGTFTVFLCSDHSVHTVGVNENGECGVGNFETPQLTITNISNNGSLSGREVASIHCTVRTTHVRCTDGTIHAWGQGSTATIGDGEIVDRNLPVEITASGALAGKTVIGFADGGGGTSNHQLAIVDGGKGVVSWGKGDQSQLCDGGTQWRATPIDVTQNIFAVLDP